MLWATEDQWEASIGRRRRRLSSRSEMREESGAGVRTRALWWRRKVAADVGRCRVLVCVVSPAWPLGQTLPRTHCPAGRDKQTSDKLQSQEKTIFSDLSFIIPVQHWAELDISDRDLDGLRPQVTHQDEDEGGARPDGDDDRQPQTHRGRPRANEERWEDRSLCDYL